MKKLSAYRVYMSLMKLRFENYRRLVSDALSAHTLGSVCYHGAVSQ